MTGFQYRHQVSFADTNVVGNVYFARYLDWQGRCREMFLHQHACDVAREVASGGLALVTLTCEMEYFEECFAFDELVIEMTPGATAGNRLGMRFRYDRAGVEVARGSQTVACMSRSDHGLQPAPIPATLLDAMRRFT